MNYRSVADLHDAIVRNLHRFPRSLDLVVGIPRSGLLPGMMLALTQNLPLADLEGFLAGRILTPGHTRRHALFDRQVSEMANVLVIDDSISSGKAMSDARNRVQAAFPDKVFTFCAVYGIERHPPNIDLVLEVVPLPRLFQWNVLHHPLLEKCCVDMDGVLCAASAQAETDDGETYMRSLLKASSIYIPTREVGYLITARPEKYRSQTEAWLRERAIAYHELIMLDLPGREGCQGAGVHARHKGETFRRLDSPLFIQNDRGQAPDIARISGKRVLCLETQQLLVPGPIAPVGLARRFRTWPRRIRRYQDHQVDRVKMIARRLFGEEFYAGVKRLMGRKVL